MYPPGRRGGSGAVGTCRTNTCCGKQRGSGRPEGWGLPFGVEKDNEYVLRHVMSADNYWLFCDNKERLVCRVNDIFEELLGLDMESKPESSWWTCTFKDEVMATLRVGSRGKTWDLPFREVFDVLGYRLHRDGWGVHGAERAMCKGTGSWWRDKVYLSDEDCPWRRPMCVYSTALNGSINLPWNGAMLTKVRAWEAKILRLTFQAHMLPDEGWINDRISTARTLRH